MLKLFKNKIKGFNLAPKRRFNFSEISRGKDRPSYDIQLNDLIHNFRVTKIEDHPEFSVRSYQLEHEKTKAKYVHLDTTDTNNCFAALIRTLPFNSRGAPHILEHLALCGSKKFPIRDPFFKMIRRSLNTYMNAWTGPDFTCYPFSSQNPKDFYNLMDVYMDTVLHANLDYYDFLQEGWRLAFSEKGNTNSDLIYQGVVFNEMKGVYQSPQSYFGEQLMKNVYPGTIYALSSGGNPQNIPELSHQELKKFYETWYHPSNLQLFSYGDLDFRKHLQFLEENYLKDLSQKDINRDIQNTRRCEEPREIKLKGPQEAVSLEKGKQAKLAVSFLIGDLETDLFENFALSLLSHMLFETPNSPAYIALLDSGLAPSYCPGYGFESSLKESSFTIGVQNVEEGEESLKKIEQVIDAVIKDVEEKGFDQDLIQGTLHQFQLRAKLPTADFGIEFLGRYVSHMVHKNNFLDHLKIDSYVERLNDELKKGDFFQNLVRKHLINNKNRVVTIMTPDPQFNEKLQLEEKSRLSEIASKLSENEKGKIVEECATLEAHQKKQQNIDILPGLQISDISKQVEKTVGRKVTCEGVPVTFFDQPMNGLTYFRFKFNLEDMGIFYRQYLDILCSFLPRLGSSERSHQEMGKLLDLYTTGFNINYESYSDPNDVSIVKQALVVTVACLDQNTEKALDIISELLLHPDFRNDKDHLKNLLSQTSSDRANSLIDSSLDYALNYSAAKIKESFSYKNRLHNTQFLCRYSKNALKSPLFREYIEDLDFNTKSILDLSFNQKRISIAVHSSEANTDSILRNIEKTLKKTEARSGRLYHREVDFNKKDIDEDGNAIAFNPEFTSHYFLIPSQVNFVAQSFLAPGFNDPMAPSMAILSNLLSNSILHEEVREKGGAYGSGCRYNTSGVIQFQSYRDPNSFKTFDCFKYALDWASEGKMKEEDLKEAKLTFFSKFDRCVAPQFKGLNEFLYGLTDDMRSNYRERLLSTTKEELILAAREIKQSLDAGKSSKVIFGSEQNSQLPGNEGHWKVERPIEDSESKGTSASASVSASTSSTSSSSSD